MCAITVSRVNYQLRECLTMETVQRGLALCSTAWQRVKSSLLRALAASVADRAPASGSRADGSRRAAGLLPETYRSCLDHCRRIAQECNEERQLTRT